MRMRTIVIAACLGMSALLSPQMGLGQSADKKEVDPNEAKTFNFYVGTDPAQRPGVLWTSPTSGLRLVSVAIRPAFSREDLEKKDEPAGNRFEHIRINFPALSLNVKELSPVLRSQLNLPANHGIVIVKILDDSKLPAANEGLILRGGRSQIVHGSALESSAENSADAGPATSSRADDPEIVQFNVQPGQLQIMSKDDLEAAAKENMERLSKDFQPQDILLSADGLQLRNADDLLAAILKAGQNNEIQIEARRNKASIRIAVRAEELVLPSRRKALFEPLARTQNQYLLGVVPGELDKLSRKLLQLPPELGVVVEKVISGSPAEKAGMQQHDIIEYLNEQMVGPTKPFMKLVQESKGSQIRIKLLRKGEEKIISVTPEAKRQFAIVGVKVSTDPNEAALFPWWTVSLENTPIGLPGPPHLNRQIPLEPEGLIQQGPTTAATPEATRESIRSELDAIRKSMDSLRDTLKRIDDKLVESKEPKQSEPAEVPQQPVTAPAAPENKPTQPPKP